MFKFSFNDPKPSPTSPRTSSTAPPATFDAPPRPHPLAASPFLPSAPHDAVPLCESALLLRKSIATPPPHLSPTGADILPATYEGGYKLWECAVDLAEHLYRAEQPRLRGSAVLELGAGHAFPAIVAAKCGADPVHVQDYNAEVLDDVTAPNLRANVPRCEHVVKLFAGAWAGLPPVLGRKYPVVLSSDTVYAKDQIEQLAECILAVLPVGGVAFVAGKTYYFGVGGGTREFAKRVKEMAAEADGVRVEVDVVKEIRDGCSNVREILKVRRL